MRDRSSNGPRWLFAYGTLAPADEAEERRGGWVAEAVRGRLFDLGPYPALVGLDEADAGWVEGFARPVAAPELLGALDPYEGVDEGLYRRAAARGRSGRPVWVYVFARPLPADARGPLARWEGRGRTDFEDAVNRSAAGRPPLTR